MTDLTEKWQKWELPTTWYYTKLWKGCNVIDKFIGNQFLRYDDSDIVEVIAPVPSYEEWQANEKYNKHLEEVIKIYERKDKQATETSIAYNELLEENTKLKELLKECVEYVKKDYGDYLTYTQSSIYQEISIILGEDK